MNVLVYLVPLALGLGLMGLFAFLWALRSGQYSDVDGAALRVLSDDDLDGAVQQRTTGLPVSPNKSGASSYRCAELTQIKEPEHRE